MKNKYQIKLKTISIIALVFFLNVKAIACYCEYPSVCEAYSRAKKVFVGKLEKVVEDEKVAYYTIEAHFSVEKIYKGKTGDLEIVKFKLSDCSQIKFIVGETYFVYSENLNTNSYCNRTNQLSVAKLDSEYVNNLSITKPIFKIYGSLFKKEQVSDSNVVTKKLYKIKIRNNKKFYKVSSDKNGDFNFITNKEGVYHIEILLPYLAEIEADNDSARNHESVKISIIKNQTRIEYVAVFKPNECDNKKFRIVPLAK